MSLVLQDRVRETTNVVGTGPATLLGAVAGYQAFSVVGDANTCYYTIADQQGVNWEVGIGTYSSTGPTLTRTTILSSSNAGSVVSFTFGTKDIFLTYPSEKAVYLDDSDNVQPNLGAASFTSITDSGNLTFTGTGNRITGDFSNATVANRVSFQTSTTNGASNVGVIPNGTGAVSLFTAFNSSDPTNCSTAQLGNFNSEVSVRSAITGTGTYLPLTMYTGGSERLRIDTSGNVGIGNIPAAWTSAARVLQVGNAGLLNNFNSTVFSSNVYRTGGGYTPTYITTAPAGELGYNADGTYAWTFSNAVTGTAGTTATLNERMRIDFSGNVGIGTSSPAALLSSNVNGVGSVTALNLTNSNNGFAAGTGTAINFGINNANLGTFGKIEVLNQTATTGSNSYMALSTRGGNVLAERMRITSGGEVYIAGTTDQGAFNLQVNGTGVWGAGAYTNGSDARIKEDIAPIDSGLDVVQKLNPVTYKYKEDWSKDQSTQTGFIAQELLVALEGKNYVDGVVSQGGEYMSVAYQNIIPILTKAIQEQQTLITSLTARIAALENN